MGWTQFLYFNLCNNKQLPNLSWVFHFDLIPSVEEYEPLLSIKQEHKRKYRLSPSDLTLNSIAFNSSVFFSCLFIFVIYQRLFYSELFLNILFSFQSAINLKLKTSREIKKRSDFQESQHFGNIWITQFCNWIPKIEFPMAFLNPQNSMPTFSFSIKNNRNRHELKFM